MCFDIKSLRNVMWLIGIVNLSFLCKYLVYILILGIVWMYCICFYLYLLNFLSDIMYLGIFFIIVNCYKILRKECMFKYYLVNVNIIFYIIILL